ncbi:hypothetical protein AXK30_03230 [Escherichia coli]|nr:hypothetical protein AXK30_03230 [Escherichia coli]
MSNQPTSLPEEDIEFVMDTFQRSMGKSKPVRDTQLEGEKPQSKESANSTENPGYERILLITLMISWCSYLE